MASTTNGRPDQFYLRAPREGGRTSFRIIRRKRPGGGKPTKNETVESPALAALNAQYLAGKMSFDEAREAAEREISRLRELATGGKKITMRPSNLRILERYWKTVYATRLLVDAASAKNRLRRAVEALGDTPLTADRTELQAAVNQSADKDANRQRDMVSALNQILKWLGRTDVVLTRAAKARRRVKYITLADFAKIVPHIKNEQLQILAWVAISTGCRAGEIFAMTESSYRKLSASVFIDTQIRRNKDEAEPKNRRQRDVPIIREGITWVEKWLALDDKVRASLRNRRFADAVGAACKAVFKDDKKKILTLHDLRHCYAIHLLQKSVSMEMVAQALGDSIEVVQEHYAGFNLTPEGLDSVRKKLDA